MPNATSRRPSKTLWIWGLGLGCWDLTLGSLDDWSADYGVYDDVPPHVQAEGDRELSVPEGADVSEIPRQAGAHARRERSREVRRLRPVLRGVPGGCDLS